MSNYDFSMRLALTAQRIQWFSSEANRTFKLRVNIAKSYSTTYSNRPWTHITLSDYYLHKKDYFTR